MTLPIFFESKKSLQLFGLSENFSFLKELYIINKLPKILMFSGRKGSGKSTLINHLMFFIFDRKNYDEIENKLNHESIFLKQFTDNIFSNIIFLSGSDFKNIKIEDIRNLKKKIFHTTISNNPRFIILDDVELFNTNSLNALLKIIEEPNINNNFILINNKSKPLLETIKSRCLEIKIILNEKKRLQIIESLRKNLNLNLTIDPKSTKLTPGYFIKFNYFFEENHISLENDYIKNLVTLLNLYKINKEIIFIDMILFLTDCYFNELKINNTITNDKIVEYKRFVFDNINKFFLYNLNQNALLNAISSKISNE
jgi:DNA polymerase-3 subunit delta'